MGGGEGGNTTKAASAATATAGLPSQGIGEITNGATRSSNGNIKRIGELVGRIKVYWSSKVKKAQGTDGKRPNCLRMLHRNGLCYPPHRCMSSEARAHFGISVLNQHFE